MYENEYVQLVFVGLYVCVKCVCMCVHVCVHVRVHERVYVHVHVCVCVRQSVSVSKVYECVHLPTQAFKLFTHKYKHMCFTHM